MRSRALFHTRAHQPGQVLVVAVVALTALLAFTALVINVGGYLVDRRHLQNAADAAALAGALQIAEEQSSRSFRDALVFAAIDNLARQNKVDVGGTRQLQAAYLDALGNPLGSVGTTSPFPATAVGLHVTISGAYTTILPSFIGQGTIQAQAEAEAQLKRLAFAPTLAQPVPLAAPQAAFEANAAYDLYDQTVANASYGVAGYRPFLDLSNAANSGTGYAAGTSYGDLATNLQFWSDGLHTSGQVGVGSRLALATAGSAASVRAGLLDNVRRQGRVDASGASYALLAVPLWNTYLTGSPNRVEIVGYGTFKILASDVTTTTLRGYFVPSTLAPPLPTPTTGVPWGPSTIALVR